MNVMWHTSDSLFEASCVFVGAELSSAPVGLVGLTGSRCFDFADFALESC